MNKKTTKKPTPSKQAKRLQPRTALPATPPAPQFRAEGKMSTFGGPDDHGVGVNEGLALFTTADLKDPKFKSLFLAAPPPGTTGLARRLNPDKYYLACRWDYNQTSQAFLRNTQALVQNPQNGKQAYGQPADWGPNVSTGRIADVSPGLAAALGLDTDDDVIITITAGTTGTVALAIESPTDTSGGHGSSNSSQKPEIKEFIESPNHSSRNGARIEMIVLHCTEGSLTETLNTFKQAGGKNPVSAHYVIDDNGEIYQMVRDSDRAWHCMGANSNSIGIEHVAGQSDAMTDGQGKASASLIRWLLAEYDIPNQNVYGHDFTPGYNRPGGTSCPDKLFGSAHTQQAVADWVTQNV